MLKETAVEPNFIINIFTTCLHFTAKISSDNRNEFGQVFMVLNKKANCALPSRLAHGYEITDNIIMWETWWWLQALSVVVSCILGSTQCDKPMLQWISCGNIEAHNWSYCAEPCYKVVGRTEDEKEQSLKEKEDIRVMACLPCPQAPMLQFVSKENGKTGSVGLMGKEHHSTTPDQGVTPGGLRWAWHEFISTPKRYDDHPVT